MQKLILIAVATAALALPAFAGTHKIPAENSVASITIPDSWKTDEIDTGIEAVSADGEVYIAVEKVDASGVSKAMDEGIAYLKSKGVTLDDSSIKQGEGKINGLDAVNIDWNGKDEDGPAKVSMMIISAAGDKGVIILYWASPEGEKKNQEDLGKIAQSIKKV